MGMALWHEGIASKQSATASFAHRSLCRPSPGYLTPSSPRCRSACSLYFSYHLRVRSKHPSAVPITPCWPLAPFNIHTNQPLSCPPQPDTGEQPAVTKTCPLQHHSPHASGEPTADTRDVKKVPTPPRQPEMYWPPWYCTQWAGQQYVRGPVPVEGVYSCPQAMSSPWGGPYGFGGPPPPYAAAPPAEKKEEKKEEKLENPDAPPKLDEGVNYMLHNGHTMLHIFNKAAAVWDEKYRTQEL